MKATICVGISASGKTFWAEQEQKRNPYIDVVCRDYVREEMIQANFPAEQYTGRQGVQWDLWNWKDEPLVTEQCDLKIAKAADFGLDLIIADTNLDKVRRDALIDKLTGLGYQVDIKLFPISLEEAFKRDARRPNGVGMKVIAEQYERFRKEFPDLKVYVPNPSLVSAVMVDLDGTLAHTVNRKAYDWAKVGEDKVDNSVRGFVCAMNLAGANIIVLSGRDGVCYNESKEWLEKNYIPYDELIMRTKGDMRKDAIVKNELFWEHVAPRYNVVGVIDDRPQVCDMWREIGLKVFQVGNPYVRF
jgi:predicted kinase